VYGVCNHRKRQESLVTGRHSHFFYFFFTLSLLNDPISWCRSRSALIPMAFDSLHLSPSNYVIKVMKSNILDSKSKVWSTCTVCVTIERDKSHRVAGLIFFICCSCWFIHLFLSVSFFGLFIFLLHFFNTSFYFTLTLHCAMNQPFWPFSIRFRVFILTVLGK
jgi:hypothetical protein